MCESHMLQFYNDQIQTGGPAYPERVSLTVLAPTPSTRHYWESGSVARCLRWDILYVLFSSSHVHRQTEMIHNHFSRLDCTTLHTLLVCTCVIIRFRTVLHLSFLAMWWVVVCYYFLNESTSKYSPFSFFEGSVPHSLNNILLRTILSDNQTSDTSISSPPL